MRRGRDPAGALDHEPGVGLYPSHKERYRSLCHTSAKHTKTVSQAVTETTVPRKETQMTTETTQMIGYMR